MGQSTVDPGSLESAAALLRGAHDDGLTMLARAITDDVRHGVSGAESNDASGVLGPPLTQVTEFVREQTEAISGHLDTAAGAYRRTDWLVRVVFAERS
ncbi:hypothetical protein [Flexivirga alba]|uniref:Uncharacterized protein n=1 Tax=Flexivirga alba TaxID=702742 RepID=A0ABW2AMC2_9MICO